MMKLNRFTLVAAVLALGMAACGDDVQVVEPTPPVAPPPPPVEASMAPASASVAVGSSVVFAVTASGGVAGEAASWTCASSNTGIATVSVTSAGCQATGVAAGEVTITAAVSKSGETVNVGASLTVTSDEPPPPVAGDPAFILISIIEDASRDVAGDGTLAGRVEVDVSIDRGDQELEELSLLVDGNVVASQSFGTGMGMAVPADGAAEQAGGNATVTMAFDSDAYDIHDDHTDVAFMNGEHTIQAELEIGVDMADGTHGHETISSNAITVEFANSNGVHVVADYPGNKATNPTTGEVWYGGPGGSIFAITVFPVVFSGGGVESVGIREFCDTDLTTDTEAPYEFEIDCEGESGSEEPEFVVTIDGRTLGRSESQALNDALFPINLDYEAPTPPVFRPNPGNDYRRQEGWINAAVDLVGEYHSTRNPDGWLTYYDDDSDGVGGYIPLLRYSTDDPAVVASARAAEPSEEPVLPATSRKDRVCFVVTAKDLLGNESALPSSSRTCRTAESYGELVTALGDALDALDDADTEANRDAVSTARRNLRNAGLLGGVDVTAPTAEFVRSGLDEDARATDDEFIVEVTDERNGSGIHEGQHMAFIASLEIRDAEETQCIIDGEPEDSPRLCEDPYTGLTALEEGIVATDEVDGIDYTGYYTFAGRAQDKAGNLSEEISRVALNDMTFAARAALRVRANRRNLSAYTLDVAVDDDLSIRDGYVGFTVTGGIPGAGANAALPIRLGDVIDVDPYNSPILTTDLPLSQDVGLPFLALQDAAGGDDPSEVENFQVYVRDQRGAPIDLGTDGATGGGDDEFYTMASSAANVADQGGADLADGIAAGVAIAVTVAPASGTTVDDGDDITLTATVTVPAADVETTRQIDETDPPFKRVYFYALSTNGTGQENWRLIESLGRNAYDDGATANTIEYEVEINAADYYDIVDDDGRGNHTGGMVIAIGVANDLAALEAVVDDPDTTDDETAAAEAAVRGVVGLVSAPAAIPTIDP